MKPSSVVVDDQSVNRTRVLERFFTNPFLVISDGNFTPSDLRFSSLSDAQNGPGPVYPSRGVNRLGTLSDPLTAKSAISANREKTSSMHNLGTVSILNFGEKS